MEKVPQGPRAHLGTVRSQTARLCLREAPQVIPGPEIPEIAPPIPRDGSPHELISPGHSIIPGERQARSKPIIDGRRTSPCPLEHNPSPRLSTSAPSHEGSFPRPFSLPAPRWMSVNCYLIWCSLRKLKTFQLGQKGRRGLFRHALDGVGLRPRQLAPR